jgi:hypothetical protein
MNRSVLISETKHQATVTSWIVRIVFNNLPTLHNTSHFQRTDHSFRSSHLSYGMGQEQDPHAGNLNLFFNAGPLGHAHMINTFEPFIKQTASGGHQIAV